MNTKMLSSIIVVFTVLIFWGNHDAVQSDAQGKGDCKECRCLITVGMPTAMRPDNLVDISPGSSWGRKRTDKEWSELENPKRDKKESCSVVFRKDGGKLVTESLVVGVDDGTRFSCGVSVFCGRSTNASVVCGRNNFNVQTNTKCSMYCLPGGVTASSCEIWNKLRPPKAKPATNGGPGAESAGVFSRTTESWSTFFASTKISGPFLSDFLPANYDPGSEEEGGEVVAPSARWRLLGGEAGFDQGIFTVASGEAEVRSFCTGDTLRLAGPSVTTLPTCPVDIGSSWLGDYTRRLPKETSPPISISLDLRNESGALKGEIKTPDGTFNIVSARQNGTGLELEASGLVAGEQRRMVLNGKLTKGDIVFDGIESGIGGATYKLLGAVRRMYIADSGILPAVVNQPYSFSLTAISPDGGAITFGLAGGQLPRGITFDGRSGMLSGTATEPGVFNFRVLATDTGGNLFEQSLTLTVKKMMVATRLLPDAFVGQPYSAFLKVIGGQAPYRFSGFPPKGLTLDPATGELKGTPTSNKFEPSSFTVQDAQNNSETQNVSLKVRGTTILNSHFLPEATQGAPYRTQFQVVGNNLPTTWSTAESYFDITSIGLTLNPATGEISGTATKTGQFVIKVLAKTTSSDQQFRNFTMVIKPGAKPR